MKYAVFAIAALGVPPLAFLLYINKKWLGYLLAVIAVALCFYIPTSINFYSHEHYRGSARGMEISLVHLLALAMVLSFILGHKLRHLAPDWGTRIFFVYVLLYLPGFYTAESTLFAWFEVWKHMMLYLFFIAIYAYLDNTRDIESVIKMLALMTFANFFFVVRDHFGGTYQPHGIFPHQNGMAMGMQLLGPMFFACYLTHGLRTRLGRICAVAFVCAAGATIRSYSRMAIALTPVAYSIPFFLLVGKVGMARTIRRIAPFALIALVAFAMIIPRIIQRYQNAPEASGNTRVEFALCAWEMIKDEPIRGVGANNWGIKINAPYEYAELAGRKPNYGADYLDGIVETVYLLVAAECGIPALIAMLAWFLWYLVRCFRMLPRLEDDPRLFIPAGFAGGLTAIYLQSFLEWVLRQQLSLLCLMLCFALLAHVGNTLPLAPKVAFRRRYPIWWKEHIRRNRAAATAAAAAAELKG